MSLKVESRPPSPFECESPLTRSSGSVKLESPLSRGSRAAAAAAAALTYSPRGVELSSQIDLNSLLTRSFLSDSSDDSSTDSSKSTSPALSRNHSAADFSSLLSSSSFDEIPFIPAKDLSAENPEGARSSALKRIQGNVLETAPPDDLTLENKKKLSENIYKTIKDENQEAKKDSKTRTFPNSGHNRYTEIAPHEDHYCSVEGRYINASCVVLAQKTYFLAQAPLEFTVDDFFQLILQQEIDTIVTLAMPMENNRIKAHDYWTPNLTPHPEMVLMSQGSEQVVKRVLSIKGKEVFQLHYQNWPDHGKPQVELLLELIKEANKSSKPLMVHCSAGIGRAGVFAITDALLHENPPLNKVPLTQRILEARACRPGILTGAVQVEAVVEAFLAGQKKA